MASPCVRVFKWLLCVASPVNALSHKLWLIPNWWENSLPCVLQHKPYVKFVCSTFFFQFKIQWFKVQSGWFSLSIGQLDVLSKCQIKIEKTVHESALLLIICNHQSVFLWALFLWRWLNDENDSRDGSPYVARILSFPRSQQCPSKSCFKCHKS